MGVWGGIGIEVVEVVGDRGKGLEGKDVIVEMLVGE